MLGIEFNQSIPNKAENYFVQQNRQSIPKAGSAGEASCTLLTLFSAGWLIRGTDCGDYLSREAAWLGGEFILESKRCQLHFCSCLPWASNISLQIWLLNPLSSEHQTFTLTKVSLSHLRLVINTRL